MQEDQLLSDISKLFVQSKWLVSSIWVNLKKVSPGNSSLISYKKKRMNNHSLFLCPEQDSNLHILAYTSP